MKPSQLLEEAFFCFRLLALSLLALLRLERCHLGSGAVETRIDCSAETQGIETDRFVPTFEKIVHR